MFGDRFFGARFYGNRYFGPRAGATLANPYSGPTSWTATGEPVGWSRSTRDEEGSIYADGRRIGWSRTTGRRR